jgi:L-asparagine transporter-like permease
VAKEENTQVCECSKRRASVGRKQHTSYILYYYHYYNCSVIVVVEKEIEEEKEWWCWLVPWVQYFTFTFFFTLLFYMMAAPERSERLLSV